MKPSYGAAVCKLIICPFTPDDPPWKKKSLMRMRDIDPAHPLLFNIQDNVVLLAQGAVYDDRETERLGQSDAAVILLRKLYERELKALIDGKPVKDWKRPKERLQLGFHEAAAV